MRVGLWRRLSTEELMLLNCGVGEDSWESLGLQGDPTSPFWRSALGFLWKEWCWSWNSSTLAISCEELTYWKRPWYWEVLGAGGEGEERLNWTELILIIEHNHLEFLLKISNLIEMSGIWPFKNWKLLYVTRVSAILWPIKGFKYIFLQQWWID